MSPSVTDTRDSRNGYTRLLSVDPSRIGHFKFSSNSDPWLEPWELSLRDDTPDASHLREAAELLLTASIPVAFPTETVYGLGADATRSDAVKGIFKAKQRPSDNPLIVHVCSLDQLRALLRPKRSWHNRGTELENNQTIDRYPPWDSKHSFFKTTSDEQILSADPIPPIYLPLIRRFWPGPLTILLANPPDMLLAPEVTAGLGTFGARMPDNPLALALIKLAGVPLAAPSANASTRPSPTTAEHVKEDLEDRIEVIIDGGPCSVGVESTVVDGLSSPPAILRPGGIGIEQLRECEGWKNVVVGYREEPEQDSKPKAPGMKYRHYSPEAKVILYEPGQEPPSLDKSIAYASPNGSVGIIRTKSWRPLYQSSRNNRNSTGYPHVNNDCGPCAPWSDRKILSTQTARSDSARSNTLRESTDPLPMLPCSTPAAQQSTILITPVGLSQINNPHDNHTQHTNSFITLWDISLGPNNQDIARGIFAALRELDRKRVDIIFVEGIEAEGDLAAAVMNRLRKAAA